MTDIRYSETRDLPPEGVLALYRANNWSSAEKPRELLAALAGSHSLVSAWQGEKIIGLGNAISDGYLVVYYPHLLVHPSVLAHKTCTEFRSKCQDAVIVFSC